MKSDLFQSCGHCWVFQICWHIEWNIFKASSLRIWNSSTGIPLPPLAFLLIIFWKLITLQYCIGFVIHQHESATGVHVFPILNPPPSPYHLSGSSQCTSPKHPVSCIEPRLAIRFLYDIHVSMPFSQIIPPSPCPTTSKRLFYTSVSLLLSCIQGYSYHLSKFCMLFSFQIMSDSLGPHELQHIRLLCPSPSLGIYPSSCPMNWCHPTISSSVTLFILWFRSFLSSGSFPMSQLFHQVAKVLELQHQSIQGW